MKLLICKAGAFCCSFAFLLPFAGVAQKTSSNATKVSANGEVVAVVPWTISTKANNLICEVSEKRVDVGSIRVLTIYRAEGNGRTEVSRFETPDSLVGMYQTGDYKGRFVTLWMGGSAYHVRVWNFVDGRVKSVLDQGAKLPPELVYDDEGKESVLITDPVIENGRWSAIKGTTTVFKWNGESYSKIGPVPWAKRFQ